MDAFFVGVELLDRPELRGRPVVVGGAGRRGVVAAASYEARSYGVFSAQPMAVARRLCPHAVILDGRHDRYREISGQVMAIFRDVTPLVEPLSLDEAFLDVTGRTRGLGPAPQIAQMIRDRVLQEVGLSCSVGVAPNKFLAKLASQRAKPTATPTGPVPGPGVLEIAEDAALVFLHALPVEAIWGVGPATLTKLQQLGIATVADLADIDAEVLVRHLGRASGRHLAALAWGRDDRPVESSVGAKSISHEETFPEDIADREVLERELLRLADSVGQRLRDSGVVARTIGIKVRFAGFRTVTRSVTPAAPVDDGLLIASIAQTLLAEVEVAGGIRLIGVAASQLIDPPATQLALDLTEAAVGASGPLRTSPRPRSPELIDTLDSIRSRFGRSAIGPARLAGAAGAAASEPGTRLWGPAVPVDEPGGSQI